jgi:predicted HTH transcriptional regulator
VKYSKVIGKDESENMEWKPSLSQINEIVETVSALSNANGGRIAIGVSRSGKILGVKIGKVIIKRLRNRIVGNADPKFYARSMLK